ncbi:MAG TPA: hypothetical protein DEP46_18310 [Blastocatellia bacterium]|nr:hypothetical protein [Blastocatellia bacterium]
MNILGHEQMQPIKVRSGPFPAICLAVSVFILIPLGGSAVYSGLIKGDLFSIGLGTVLLFCFIAILAVGLWSRSRSVKRITSSGVEFGDGTEAPWSSLKRVVDHFGYDQYGVRLHTRTDLEFTGGRTASLVPSRMSNFDEAYAIVMSADCEKIEK